MTGDTTALSLRWPGPPASRLLDATTASGSGRERDGQMGQAAAPAAHRPRKGGRPAYSARDLCALAWHARRVWMCTIVLGGAVGALLAALQRPASPATALLLYPGADEVAMLSELSILHSDAVARAVAVQVGAARILEGSRLPGAFDVLRRRCDPAPGADATCIAAVVRGQLFARLDSVRAGRVLKVTAENPDPAVSLAMVQAAIAATGSIRRAAFVSARAEALQPQIAAAAHEVATIEAEEAHIRAEAGVLDITQDVTASSAAAAGLAKRDGELRERQTAVRAELMKSRNLLARTPEQVPYSREQTSRDTGEEARATLLRLRLERAHLAELYAPGYPGLAELDRKIAIAQRPQPRSTALVTRDRRNPNFDMLTAKVSALQVEGNALTVQRTEIARQAAVVAARAGVLAEAANRLSALGQRRSVQQDVARKLSIDMAQLRSQDALTTAQVDDLRLVQPASTEAGGAPTPMAAIGLLAGGIVGVLGTVAAARRRSVYVVGREVERDLSMSAFATAALWRGQRVLAAPKPVLRDLAAQLLDMTNVEGGPVSAIHVIGTADRDGTEAIAQGLAEALSVYRQARVMVLRLHRDGRGELRSLGLRTGAFGPAALRETRMPVPASAANASTPGGSTSDASASSTGANVVCALFGDPGALTGPLRDQVAGLRAMHDLVVVISAHGTVPAIRRRLSALADVDVMVVRAKHSDAQDVARLSASAASVGGRVPGFVFTSEASLWTARQA